MNFFERIFALLLIIVVTACGTAKFQGDSGKKNRHVNDLSFEPIVCNEQNPCVKPCDTALTQTTDSAAQNAAASSTTTVQTPGQNVASTCPTDDTSDDASQNNDHN